MRKTLTYLFSGTLSLYVIMCVSLYYMQESLIFNPDKLPENYTFRGGKEVELLVEEDLYLNCLLIEEEPSRGVILYLHGNRGSNQRCYRQAMVMAGNGYDIFMPDYRGYGKSEGSISSQRQLLSDVQKAYDYLKKRYGEENIVVMGYSLGTGMASYLSSRNNPKKLVLLAPYRSFVDLKRQRFPVIPDFLVKYPLNNERYLRDVSCPVMIVHGTGDDVIPYSSALYLSNIRPVSTELITLHGTSHRGAIFSETFSSSLATFIRE